MTAPDVLAVLTDHADHLNDLGRRLGLDADSAVEVVQQSGADLVAACAERPDEVGDLVGWWAAAAVTLAERLVPGGPAPRSSARLRTAQPSPAPDRLTTALGRLTLRARTAVLLRDSYDLSWTAVAQGLRTSEAGAATVVADARVQLLRALGGDPAPLAAPPGVSVADLTRLADDPTPAESSADLARVRRTVSADVAARRVLAEQQQARRELRGLPVLALDTRERTTLLTRWTAQAERALPRTAPVSAPYEKDDRPVLPPYIAVLAVLGAVVAGSLVGVSTATRQRTTPSAPTTVTPTSAAPSLSATVVPDVPGVSGSASPTTSASSAVPSLIITGQHTTPAPRPSTTSAAPSPSQTTATTNPTAVPAAITLNPTTGVRGTAITVTGSGFTAGSVVTVTFNRSGPDSAVVRADGTFTATVTANGTSTVPMAYTVTATEGDGRTASATFTQTL